MEKLAAECSCRSAVMLGDEGEDEASDRLHDVSQL